MPCYFFVFLKALHDKNVLSIRKAQNMKVSKSGFKRVYRSLINYWIEKNGLSNSDYFGDIDAFNEVSKNRLYKHSIIEIMVHPGGIVDDYVFDSYDKRCLNTSIKQIIKYGAIESFKGPY